MGARAQWPDCGHASVVFLFILSVPGFLQLYNRDNKVAPYYRLNCILSRRYDELLTPGTCECDLIWKQDLCRSHPVNVLSDWIGVNPTFHEWCPYKNMKTWRHTHRGSHVRHRSEASVGQATPECWLSPAPGREGWNGSSLICRQNPPAPHLNSRFLASTTARISVCCFRPPSLCDFVPVALGNSCARS